MKLLPITLRETQLRMIADGDQTMLRRPVGMLSRAAKGDRLWIREPFAFEPRFDHLSPTAAASMGARTIFLTEAAARAHNIGCTRFARNLPRACHRWHLRVLDAFEQSLQDIDDADAREEGCADRRHFAAHWNRVHASDGRSITGGRIRWADNPRVVAIRFTLIRHPADAPEQPPEFRGHQQGASQ